MIVVDTNVLVYLFIPGEWTQQARAALMKESEWVAPYLWRSEFLNVMATYYRQKLLSVEIVRRIVGMAELMMKGRQYYVQSLAVLEMAGQSGCSAYDCEYIALAQDLNIKLLTTDGKLLSIFPNITVSLESFLR